MISRDRLFIGTLWIGVAALMTVPLSLDSGFPSSAGELAQVFVIVLALFLAGIYLLDPWGVLSRQLFQ
ncbi:hypothetical protein [Natrialba taiwanensis]|uniref:Uncharacterized protein n=1 Tax=Natrialba taiwanensis DSM 12281 TaxID=1230458 RepID=M0AEW4_9EURY|nr:hypothetical protein [Natrialba taiwanensis]ELY95883.1 hypothetical protein C484_02789 [Natrialba taiwanensis DSM 12281]